VYRVADAVVVRAATHRAAMALPDWPDLTGSTSQQVRQWRGWLGQVWPLEGLGDAIEVASPVLARQARKVIDEHNLQPGQIRRVMLPVARYLLRATGRATPFGLFAGVTPASFGDQMTARWGEDHQVILRAGAEWLAAAVSSLETCPDLLERLPVTASNLCTVRDGRLVAAAQQHIGPADGSGPARPVEVSVRLTTAEAAAIRHAQTPILAGQLGSLSVIGPPSRSTRPSGSFWRGFRFLTTASCRDRAGYLGGGIARRSLPFTGAGECL